MKSKSYPKISVITPSYNSSKYLEQAIQSVLSQNYPNFEHIIMDGGSTDGTVEILKQYPHLKWFSEPDEGQSDAMNKGLLMATGEIIVVLNADDFFEPGAFHTAVKYLDKEQGIFFIVGECNVIDEQGRKLEGYNNPRVTLFEMLQWWKYLVPLNPSSYFYYNEVHQRVGLFDKENHSSMDYDFLYRVALNYKMSKIEETLGNYRYIAGTKTFESNQNTDVLKSLSVYRKYWKYLSFRQRMQVAFSYRVYLINRIKCVSLLRRLVSKAFRV